MSLDPVTLEVVRASGITEEKQYAEALAPLRANGNRLLVTLLLGNTVVNATLAVLLNNVTTSVFGIILTTFLVWVPFLNSICFHFANVQFTTAYTIIIDFDIWRGGSTSCLHTSWTGCWLLLQMVCARCHGNVHRSHLANCEGSSLYLFLSLKDPFVPWRDTYSLYIDTFYISRNRLWMPLWELKLATCTREQVCIFHLQFHCISSLFVHFKKGFRRDVLKAVHFKPLLFVFICLFVFIFFRWRRVHVSLELVKLLEMHGAEYTHGEPYAAGISSVLVLVSQW